MSFVKSAFVNFTHFTFLLYSSEFKKENKISSIFALFNRWSDKSTPSIKSPVWENKSTKRKTRKWETTNDHAESKKTKTFYGGTGHLAIFTRMKGF